MWEYPVTTQGKAKADSRVVILQKRAPTWQAAVKACDQDILAALDATLPANGATPYAVARGVLDVHAEDMPTPLHLMVSLARPGPLANRNEVIGSAAD